MSAAMEWPRVYLVDRTKRRLAYGVAAFLAGIAVVSTAGQATGIIHRSLSPMGLAGVDLFLLAISLKIYLDANRRVILDEHAISVVGWNGARTLKRDEISSRRITHGARQRYEPYHVLLSSDPAAPALKLPPSLHTDKAFRVWLASIPLERS